MPARLQGILNRIREWWGKFSTRQKVLILSLLGVIITAIIILAVTLTRPVKVELITAEDTKQAGEIKTLLDDNGVEYELSKDGLVFTVKEEDFAADSILLGSNGIPTKGYSIDNVFNGGFSTTEADKAKKYQLYLENKYAEALETLVNVEKATVQLSIPVDDGTLIQRKQPTYASVILTLSDEMSEEQAAGIASYIATTVGNEDTNSILILDSNGNVLFSGSDSTTSAGLASTQLSLRNKLEQGMKNQVKSVLLGTDLFDNVEVGLNLAMDFSNKKVVDHQYYVAEGNTQGYLDSRSVYESESIGGNAAVPGTDTNDDTTYVIQDNEYTRNTISDTTEDFLPNEKITTTEGNGGDIDYANSSLSAVATTFVIYNEDQMKAAGQLEEMTFDEFVAANSNRVQQDLDPQFALLVSNATGIPVEKISLVAYNVPFFQYSTEKGRTLTDYLQIILVILIFAMLGYVVFRTTRKEKQPKVEPELSVEAMLESTKEAEAEELEELEEAENAEEAEEETPLEDIGFQEKSETRLAIEKFVDENPEATAALLRNWLNEDWD